MSVMVGIRCSEEQKAQWLSVASSQNRSLSNWLAMVADEAALSLVREAFKAELLPLSKPETSNAVVASPEQILTVKLAPNKSSRIYTLGGQDKVFALKADVGKSSWFADFHLRSYALELWDGAK
jgi:hypothetical protein